MAVTQKNNTPDGLIFRLMLPVIGKEIPVFDIFIYIGHDNYGSQIRDIKIENYLCKIKPIL